MSTDVVSIIISHDARSVLWCDQVRLPHEPQEASGREYPWFKAVPVTTPPKYVYEAKYHPASMPDFDMRMKDHVHFDAWLHLSFNEQDKYEFQ